MRPGPERRPSGRAVLAEQTRASALLQRPTLLVWVPVAALILGLGAAEVGPVFALGFPEAGVLLVLAVVWPLLLWRRDPPSRRAGFWAAPLHRGRHATLRIAAGWLVLAAVVAAYVVVQVALSAAVPREALWPEVAAQYVARALIAVSTLYLLVTAAALRFERPVLPVFVAFVLLQALFLLQLEPEGSPVAEAGRALSLHLSEAFWLLPAGYGSWLPPAAWLAAAVALCGAATFLYQEPDRSR